MRFVLDNSGVMRWLLQDGSDERLAQEPVEAVVPGIWALEATNVLVKAQAKGLVSEARSAAFVGLLQGMAFTTSTRTAERALGDTLQLARRFKLSSYDAAYLELALREGLAFATLDDQLRGRCNKQVWRWCRILHRFLWSASGLLAARVGEPRRRADGGAP